MSKPIHPPSASSRSAFVGPYRIKAKVPQSDIHLLTAGMVVNELVWTGVKKGTWTAEIELGLPADPVFHENSECPQCSESMRHDGSDLKPLLPAPRKPQPW